MGVGVESSYNLKTYQNIGSNLRTLMFIHKNYVTQRLNIKYDVSRGDACHFSRSFKLSIAY